MIKLLTVILLALFASVGIALLLRHDPGYVLISVGQWTIETSVATLVAALLFGFIVLYYLIRYLAALWRMPRWIKRAAERRRLRRSHRLLHKGMKHLAEGHWEAAEASLTKSAPHSEAPALHYIGAARAAHRLGADWRRDDYLRQAEKLPSQDTLVVGLTKAELLLEDGEVAKAKAGLLNLKTLYPRNARMLELLAQSYRALGEWDRLVDLLPELRKRKVLEEPQYAELQVATYQGLLEKTAASGNLAFLRGGWKQVPKPLRQEESLLIAYAGYLRDNDAPGEAEALLRDALNRRWSEKLVVGYGEIGRGDAAAQLAAAEGWLRQHEQDAYLLLTLGRLAKRGRKWDKARGYLEKSIKALPSPDAYQELGEVLEEMKDLEAASRCYRTGLRLAAGKPEEKEGVALAKEGVQQTLPVAAEKGSSQAKPESSAQASAGEKFSAAAPKAASS